MTFDEMYEAHADRVYSFLRYKIRDVHLAEDIFQETFLTAFREMTAGRMPERPQAWLLTIAHRRMVDRLRRGPKAEAPLTEGDRALPLTSGGADMTVTAELSEFLHRLDESSRTILYAQYVEGLTVREISQMLGIPEGTVKSRSHSARSKLSKWMKKGDADGA
jgi:RNA polymerase sigma-70 factor, ECF subfamily